MRYEKDEKRIAAFNELVNIGFLFSLNDDIENDNDSSAIIPYKKGFYLLNVNYDFESLNSVEKENLINLLSDLSNFSVSQLAPVCFEDRTKYPIVYEGLENAYINSEYDYITSQNCEELANDIRFDSKLVEHIAGAINAKLLIINNPIFIIKNYIFNNNNVLTLENENEDSYNIPINRECIASWLYNNNIIGVRQGEDGLYIFDSSKVGTKTNVENKHHLIVDEYGEISKILEGFTSNEKLKQFLMVSTPEEVLEFAMQFPKYKNMLESDAGNWERYTVGEHTEAVLRNFEDAYADEVSENLYPFMKFLILTHDLGKAKGKSFGGGGQKYQNAIACEEICSDLGIEDKISKLIQFIIGDSQNYTTQYYVMRNTKAHDLLLESCKEQLKEILGFEPTDSMVNGLSSICKILQTCDSGAYTAYGVVRNSETGVYHRGGNYAWTKGFKEPTDPRKKSDLRFIEPEK